MPTFFNKFSPPCEGIAAMQELAAYAEHRAGTGQPIYMSPKELRHQTETKVAPDTYECAWPNCSCERVSGIYNRERVQWLIREARENPDFSIKDVRFAR